MRQASKIPVPSQQGEPAFGFLTVVGTPAQGLFGGLLVLNRLGRPLEFHCTAPVKPNRAQQILYGPTLESFLYGEQIGAALAAKAKQPVELFLVDQPETLSLRGAVDRPLVYCFPQRGAIESPDRDLHPFEAAGHRLGVASSFQEDTAAIGSICEQHLSQFDLMEPFERIQEAIAEAQRAA